MLNTLYRNLEKSLKKNDSYFYGTSIFTILSIILIIWGMSIPFLISNWGILYMVCIVAWVISFVNGNNWLIERRWRVLSDISDKNKALIESVKSVDDIDAILGKVEEIYKLVNQMNWNLPFTDYFYSDRIHEIQKNIFQNEILFLTWVLQDLKKDLSLRLSEQGALLSEAKGKVKKHLDTLPELEDTKRIQEIRLDSQIQEFEKLQKILIKV